MLAWELLAQASVKLARAQALAARERRAGSGSTTASTTGISSIAGGSGAAATGTSAGASSTTSNEGTSSGVSSSNTGSGAGGACASAASSMAASTSARTSSTRAFVGGEGLQLRQSGHGLLGHAVGQVKTNFVDLLADSRIIARLRRDRSWRFNLCDWGRYFGWNLGGLLGFHAEGIIPLGGKINLFGNFRGFGRCGYGLVNHRKFWRSLWFFSLGPSGRRCGSNWLFCDFSHRLRLGFFDREFRYSASLPLRIPPLELQSQWERRPRAMSTAGLAVSSS